MHTGILWWLKEAIAPTPSNNRVVAHDNATIRQHDSVHLSHYRVMAFGDNATTRLYDRVGRWPANTMYRLVTIVSRRAGNNFTQYFNIFILLECRMFSAVFVKSVFYFKLCYNFMHEEAF